jgi:TraC protein
MSNSHKKIDSLLKRPLEKNFNLKKVCNLDDNYYNVTDLFVYQNYLPKQKLFFNQESLGFVLETSPIGLSSEDMGASINKLFKHLLPEDSKLQIMLFADPCTDNCISRWKVFKEDSIMHHIANKTFSYLQKFAFKSQGTPYVLRDFRYIMSFSIKSHNTPTELEKIYQIKKQIKLKLENLSLQVLEWRPKELVNILNHIVNLNHKIKPLNKNLKYNEQNNKIEYINNKISNLNAKLEIGDRQLIVSANKLAIKTYQTMPKMSFWSLKAIGEMIVNQENNNDLSQIPCPFIVSYELTVSGLQLNSIVAHNDPSEQEKLSIILLAPQEQLDKAEAILLKMSFAKKFKLQENTFCHLKEFLSSMPMMSMSNS